MNWSELTTNKRRLVVLVLLVACILFAALRPSNNFSDDDWESFFLTCAEIKEEIREEVSEELRKQNEQTGEFRTEGVNITPCEVVADRVERYVNEEGLNKECVVEDQLARWRGQQDSKALPIDRRCD